LKHIGVGRPYTLARYKKIRQDGSGIFDVLKGLFSGGVKFIGNLFKSSGAKALAKKAISTVVEKGKELAVEKGKEILQDVASNPIKYYEKGKDLVQKFQAPEADPAEIAKQEANQYAKVLINNAREKVIQPTIEQYRDEYEGVKQNVKNQLQNEIQTQLANNNVNLNNLISGMGLKNKRGKGVKNKRGTQPKKNNSKQLNQQTVVGGNKKIMAQLRGSGLLRL
jgi:hypothetical protein